MFEALIMNVNWIATIVGAVAAYALGMLWYSSKLFGPKWMEGVGLTKETLGSPTHALLTQAVGVALLAWIIGITETTNSLGLAILVAITIAVLIKANGLWINKTRYAIATEAGYVLAMVVVMIAAHAFL